MFEHDWIRVVRKRSELEDTPDNRLMPIGYRIAGVLADLGLHVALDGYNEANLRCFGCLSFVAAASGFGYLDSGSRVEGVKVRRYSPIEHAELDLRVQMDVELEMIVS